MCVLVCISVFVGYIGYCNHKLDKFVKRININEFEYNCLIIENNIKDIVVSIDTTIFKLELEKQVYNIDENIRVEYLCLDRYSPNIKVKYRYKHSYQIVEYALEKGTIK